MSEKIPNDHTDHFSPTSMMILTQRMRTMIIGETIDKAINDWYFEQGMDVPNWKYQRDPQWWIDYLEEIKRGKQID